MTEDIIGALIALSIIAVMAFVTIVPWLIGIGWMMHHWLGVA